VLVGESREQRVVPVAAEEAGRCDHLVGAVDRALDTKTCLGPGALERLSPDELQAFGSGLGAVGGSLPAFLQQYNQSRIGQNAPTAQTALA